MDGLITNGSITGYPSAAKRVFAIGQEQVATAFVAYPKIDVSVNVQTGSVIKLMRAQPADLRFTAFKRRWDVIAAIIFHLHSR